MSVEKITDWNTLSIVLNSNRNLDEQLKILRKQYNQVRDNLVQTKMENKKLKQIVEYKLSYNKKVKIEVKDIIDGINRQSVKEFAEKLKDKLGYCDEDDDQMHYSFYQSDLDEILKECGVEL